MTRLRLLAAAMIVLGACGGGANPGGSSGDAGGGTVAPAPDGNGTGSTGEVVNRQPPGQGGASVDGLEFTFDTPGAIACAVADDEFNYSYIIGDNEIVFGGGASSSGGEWFGSLTLQITADDGITLYSAKLNDNQDGIAVDGDSVSYAGPMEKFPPAPPGELSTPVDVGDGVFTSTCA